MTSESTHEHQQQAKAAAAGQPIGCAVLTISDTRTPETDRGGALLRDLLTAAGHKIVDHTICPDEPETIGQKIDDWAGRNEIHVILTTGGTGIACRDTTIEVVERRLTAKLDGFGELFRMVSFDEVGAAAMLSRATAGLIAHDEAKGGDTFLFAMPGSVNAIETAMNKLILPELAHLIWERKR